jgi:hypothetical protein
MECDQIPAKTNANDGAYLRQQPEDLEFCPLSNGWELGICLFFDAYSEDKAPIWGQIGYLLLDRALGEHDVEAKVGPSSSSPLMPIRMSHAILSDLPAIFDARFAALKREH